jgi:AFG3 family protein
MEPENNKETLKNNTEKQKDNSVFPSKNKPRFNMSWIYALLIVVILGLQLLSFFGGPVTIDWRTFNNELIQSHDIEKIVIINRETAEIFIKADKAKSSKYDKFRKVPLAQFDIPPQFTYTIPSVEVFEKQMDEAQKGFSSNERIPYQYENRVNWTGMLFNILLPFVLIGGLLMLMMRRMGSGMGGPGGQIFNIGRSKAKLFDEESKVKLTFADVAGLDEAKEEVMEIVEFLKNPKKYTALGGKIPKGALLIGGPGTGKTLLAKAMAGEAKVPFFSISGSDFVEMFVGVGASRVRDLFNQARDKAPCIIFIDEIDAIGRARGRGAFQGGNDERENTLNQLLVEMDGFGGDSGIIILAATNRPDVLDSALMRPGRFDRQISIDAPDLVGREAIFKVHLKPIKVAPGVDVKKLSELTPGFAGADIANVCNEAALIAARRNKQAVDMDDFIAAVDRNIGGLEKKNKIISPEEKRIVAYHEAGHAVCGWFLEHADPLIKVSIVPRGVAALGYAQYLPKEQYLHTTEQLFDSICMTLGGRAAEDIVFGRISTGAQNDLERITKLSYAMISIYGMNPKVGNISYYDSNGENQFMKPYSEHTAQLIDEEVKGLISRAYDRTKALLLDKRNELEILAQQLLQKEVLLQSDLAQLLGPRPFKSSHDTIEQIPEIQNLSENTQS